MPESYSTCATSATASNDIRLCFLEDNVPLAGRPLEKTLGSHFVKLCWGVMQGANTGHRIAWEEWQRSEEEIVLPLSVQDKESAGRTKEEESGLEGSKRELSGIWESQTEQEWRIKS